MAKASKKDNADKRSVHTDALETLGTGPLGPTEARDAIHLAVEPVIAGQRLFPGQDIGMLNGEAVVANDSIKALGIVDPFLKNPVQPGERFWLVIYPRTIKSLRHVWEHPDFPNETGLGPEEHPLAATDVVPTDRLKERKNAALRRIEEYAAELSGYSDEHKITAEDLLEYADTWVSSDGESRWGDYLVRGGTLEGVYTSREFWENYEIYSGIEVKEKDQNFFSCSC